MGPQTQTYLLEAIKDRGWHAVQRPDRSQKGSLILLKKRGFLEVQQSRYVYYYKLTDPVTPAQDDSPVKTRKGGKHTNQKPLGDYEVGYRKTPEHTRFQPGQSGNPRGRPRKDTEKGTQEKGKQLRDPQRQQTRHDTELVLPQGHTLRDGWCVLDERGTVRGYFYPAPVADSVSQERAEHQGGGDTAPLAGEEGRPRMIRCDPTRCTKETCENRVGCVYPYCLPFPLLWLYRLLFKSE